MAKFKKYLKEGKILDDLVDLAKFTLEKIKSKPKPEPISKDESLKEKILKAKTKDDVAILTKSFMEKGLEVKNGKLVKRNDIQRSWIYENVRALYRGDSKEDRETQS